MAIFFAPRAGLALILWRAPERLTKPLVRNAKGKLEPATWEHALRVGGKQAEGDARRARRRGDRRDRLEPHDQRRELPAAEVCADGSADQQHRPRAHGGLCGVCAGAGRARRTRRPACARLATAPAILLVGGDPTEEHPLLAWNLRTNVRLNRGAAVLANSKSIKLERQAQGYAGAAAEWLQGSGRDCCDAERLRTSARRVLAEESLVVIFGQEFRGRRLAELVAWGLKRGNVRFAFLGDHANSRGAADMGLLPDLLPGYVPVTRSRGAFARVCGPADGAGQDAGGDD